MIELVSLLPWWAGVAAALVSYLLLAAYAASPVDMAAATRPGQLGAALSGMLFKKLASVGQYLLPLVCLLGAGASAWRRRSRRQLLDDAVQRRESGSVNSMSWQQFEQLIGEAFRRQGWRVQETGGGGADGGVDLRLSKDGETWLVQCKQWRAYRVGVEVVRELYGLMAAEGAAGGYVVTSGRFTQEARAFAQGRNVRLMEGEGLGALLEGVKQPRSTNTAPHVPAGASEEPSCPLCQSGMVRRQARQGSHTGSWFWGCTQYPSCRGKRKLA